MALGASRRHVSAAAVVAIVIAATALVGAATVAGFAAAAAITIFLAFLLGRAKEPEGPFGHRVLHDRGGVDFFFRGVSSVPGEAIVAVLLRLFLEQEPEVFVVGLGFVVLGDDFEAIFLYYTN